MRFGTIHSMVAGVPFISEKNARYLYDLILRKKLTNILELGIAHGTATCFMAAALERLGQGAVTAVDLLGARDIFKPSAEEQLEQTGLSRFARIVRMQTGYTWFLHDEIARNTKDNMCQPVYDLCVIDGAKNWTIDGAAFFFVDKLLKKNGWLIFDDYNWTYACADQRRDATDGITHRSLSTAERETPHVREIFELLVRQHPHYGTLMLLDGGNWALAQKTMTDTKTYTMPYRGTATQLTARFLRRAYRMVFRRGESPSGSSSEGRGRDSRADPTPSASDGTRP
ncbi:MAG: class I SAM-dependent methyltransferase [Chloroflexota bacterium]